MGKGGEESKKVKEEKPSATAKGKSILLILDVTCKPRRQLSESSVPLSCTQSPSIYFLVAVQDYKKVLAPSLRKRLIIFLWSFTPKYSLQIPAQNANRVLLGMDDACPDSFFRGFVFTLPLRNWLFLMTFMINKTV